jgi:predicted transcriptional regulator
MTKSNNTLKANKDLPLITDLEVNSILDSLILGKTSIEIAKDLQIPLTKLYKILDQDEKLKEQFGKAQEIGMRTLIEKMLIVFDNKPDNLEASDMLFLRERMNHLVLKEQLL